MQHYIYHKGTGTLMLVDECVFVSDKEFLEDDSIDEGETFETYLEEHPKEYESISASAVLGYAGIGALFGISELRKKE
jgi:hypothetical protein